MRKGTLRNVLVASALALAGVGTMAAPAGAAPVAPVQQQQQEPAGTMTSTVQGTFTDASGGQGTVTGTFVPDAFSQQGDQVVATGTLVANLVDSAGNPVGTATQVTTLPLNLEESGGSGDVTAAAVECDILNLVLGPLDLNLLGLEVHLNRVILDIVAVTGAGNLLGNLLCAVAGLLDGVPILATLVDLLNQILELLRQP
ncbi:hypothetical protein Val02_37310 [Virgisporangium aliadipatigenens]|uniref:ABC transporter substrate-binding protein n=1 Tax=Virgisporangium aliadipatigenens TaxID=741659 RepID=A0A8J3YN09_9ACTN|nr:hypothetical protein [Virgisporangium aliadipatigenens]GIJ46845.1 hypothetical protein Val02_37310 [Virgisporangium aliadipatigenens]